MDIPIGKDLSLDELSAAVSKIKTAGHPFGPYTIVCLKSGKYQFQEAKGLLVLFSRCFGDNTLVTRYLTCALLREYHSIVPLKENEAIVGKLSWRTTRAFQDSLQQFHVLTPEEKTFKESLEQAVQDIRKEARILVGTDDSGSTDFGRKCQAILDSALKHEPSFVKEDPKGSIDRLFEWSEKVRKEFDEIRSFSLSTSSRVASSSVLHKPLPKQMASSTPTTSPVSVSSSSSKRTPEEDFFQEALISAQDSLVKESEDLKATADPSAQSKYQQVLDTALAHRPVFSSKDPGKCVLEISEWAARVRKEWEAIRSPSALASRPGTSSAPPSAAAVSKSAQPSPTRPVATKSTASSLTPKPAPLSSQPDPVEGILRELLDSAEQDLKTKKNALIVLLTPDAQDLKRQCEEILQRALRSKPTLDLSDPDKTGERIFTWQQGVLTQLQEVRESCQSIQAPPVSAAPLPSAPVITPPLTQEMFESSLESIKNGIVTYKDALIASLPPLRDLREPRAGVVPVTKESLFGGDCDRVFEEAHRHLPRYDSTKTPEENKLAIEQWYRDLKGQLDAMASDYLHIMAPPRDQVVPQCAVIRQDGTSCGPIAILQSFVHTRKFDYFLKRTLVRKPEESDEQYASRADLQRTLRDFVQENRADLTDQAHHDLEDRNVRMPQILRQKMSACYRADHQMILRDVNQQVTALRQGIVQERNPALAACAERFCRQAEGLTETDSPSVSLEGLFHDEVEMLEQIMTSSVTPEARGANPELDRVLNALHQSPNDREKYFLLRKLRWILQGKSPAEIQKKDKKLRDASQQRETSDLILNAASFFKGKFGLQENISQNVGKCFQLASSLIHFMGRQKSYQKTLDDISGSTTVAYFWFESMLKKLDCEHLVKRIPDGRIDAQALGKLTSVICNPPGHFYVYVRVGEDSWREINYRLGPTITSQDLLKGPSLLIHYGL